MADDGYDEAASHFDRHHIPADRMSQQEIRDYMQQEFREGTVPPDLQNEIAERVADMRAERADRSGAAGGDFYYDEESGRWRDPSDGSFLP
jgi:hypothetical protein